MIVAHESHGRGVADLLADGDVVAGVLDSKSLSGKDLAVCFGVQVGEAVAEAESLAADGEGAVGGLAGGAQVGGHMVDVETEEPAHAGALQLQESRRRGVR